MTEEVATWHKMNSWYDDLYVTVVSTEMLLHPSVSKIIDISCSASSSFPLHSNGLASFYNFKCVSSEYKSLRL